MAQRSAEWRQASGKVGALARWHGDDAPELLDARRDLRAAELTEHVRRIVDQFPPLTSDQRAAIASLLRAPATSP